jgi:hypothetical protein
MLRAPLLASLCALLAPHAFSQTVGVFLDFDNVPGKAPIEAMKKEVDALLKSSGVSLDWRMAGENRGKESFDGLVVLKFRGLCRAEASQPDSAPQTQALGTTLVDQGRVLPFSEVQCDAVRQALGYLRPEANQGEKQRALGLALGRVVAHELYHVLARTTPHAAHGLAKAAEPLRELVARPELPFGAEDAAAIRRGVTQ